MLKFLVDHNVSKRVSVWLKKSGYHVKLVKNIDPEMSDQKVIRIALKEGRILLTNDQDFIGLLAFRKDINAFVFRLSLQTSSLRIEVLSKIIPLIQKTKKFGLIILE